MKIELELQYVNFVSIKKELMNMNDNWLTLSQVLPGHKTITMKQWVLLILLQMQTCGGKQI